VVWRAETEDARTLFNIARWRIMKRDGKEEEVDDVPGFPACSCGGQFVERHDPLCPKCLSERGCPIHS
jgi:hypothetical protein